MRLKEITDSNMGSAKMNSINVKFHRDFEEAAYLYNEIMHRKNSKLCIYKSTLF